MNVCSFYISSLIAIFVKVNGTVIVKGYTYQT